MSQMTKPRLLGDSLRKTPAWNTALVLITTLAIGLTSVLPWLSAPSLFAIQVLIVLLSAAILGWVRSLCAVVLYAAAVLAGAPWLANGQSAITEDGLTWSAGYVLGMGVGAVVVGLLAKRGWTGTFVDSFLMLVLGLLSVYAIGVPWLKVASGASWAWALDAGMTIFMLPTAIAIIVGAGLLSYLRRRVTPGDTTSRAIGDDEELVIDLTDEVDESDAESQAASDREESGSADSSSEETLDLTDSDADAVKVAEPGESVKAD
ncbi:MAG: biotin transporter BioY [Actinobacteria bacterium]|nr:biotin transporter BioY [Actinomycetota bacterium]